GSLLLVCATAPPLSDHRRRYDDRDVILDRGDEDLADRVTAALEADQGAGVEREAHVIAAGAGVSVGPAPRAATPRAPASRAVPRRSGSPRARTSPAPAAPPP